MKRFTKILFNIIAIVMLVTTCIGLTACTEDIKQLEVTVSVYSTDDEAMVEKTLKVDLYRHLAPETVDHIIKNCVNKNYYDNAFFYKFDDSTTRIMMGDYVYENDAIVKNDELPTVKGEFKQNGVVGSNLLNKQGSICLWRDWTKNDNTYTTNGAFNTGKGTWCMPTESMSDYNDYFCVFAQIDLDDETNSETWNAIKNVFTNTDYYEKYTVYYTGEYESLEFHCEKTADLDLKDGDYFVAEGDEYVSYDKRDIRVPFVEVGGSKVLAAYIKGIKLI